MPPCAVRRGSVGEETELEVFLMYKTELQEIFNRINHFRDPLEDFYTAFTLLIGAVPKEFCLDTALERAGNPKLRQQLLVHQLLTDFAVLTNGSGKYPTDEAPTALIRAGNLDLTDPYELTAAKPFLDRLLPYYAEVKKLHYIIFHERQQVGEHIMRHDDLEIWEEEPYIRDHEHLCLCEFNGDSFVVLSCEQGGDQ